MSMFGDFGSIVTDGILDWVLPKEVKSGLGCLAIIIMIPLLIWILWPHDSKGLTVDVEIPAVGIEAIWVNGVESDITKRSFKNLPQHAFYAIGIKNHDKLRIELTDRDVECTFDSWWYNDLKVTVHDDNTNFEYHR